MVADDRCELLCIDLPRAEALRQSRLAPETVARMAEQANALGDPTRLTVAAALSEVDELCVCDLAWIVGRSVGLVSHHLRVLRTAELVRARKEGKLVLYTLTERGEDMLRALHMLDRASA